MFHADKFYSRRFSFEFLDGMESDVFRSLRWPWPHQIFVSATKRIDARKIYQSRQMIHVGCFSGSGNQLNNVFAPLFESRLQDFANVADWGSGQNGFGI